MQNIRLYARQASSFNKQAAAIHCSPPDPDRVRKIAGIPGHVGTPGQKDGAYRRGIYLLVGCAEHTRSHKRESRQRVHKGADADMVQQAAHGQRGIQNVGEWNRPATSAICDAGDSGRSRKRKGINMARTKNSEIYNHEGYTDPTAYFGMMEKGGIDRSQITRDIRRGEIYYIAPEGGSPLERKNRPGIIVSSDQANRASDSFEVVYLTTKTRRPLLCDVAVNGPGAPSTALCGKVHTVYASRIGNYAGAATEAEMKEIDRALMHGLGIIVPEKPTAPEPKSRKAEPTAENTKLAAELTQATVERNLYKKLYDQLFSEIMTRTYKGE